MALADLLSPSAASQYLAALLMLGLAVWLVLLDPRGRINRAFALVLGLRSLNLVVATANGITEDTAIEAATLLLNNVTVLWLAAALVHFAAIYPKPTTLLGRNAWGGWALLAFTLLSTVLLIQQPCMMFCKVGMGEAMHYGVPIGDGTETRWGFLVALNPVFLSSIIGAGFLLQYSKTTSSVQKEALLLVGGVFTLNAIFDGVRRLVPLMELAAAPGSFGDALRTTAADSPGLYVFAATNALILPIGLMGLAMAAPRAWQDRARRPRHVVLVVLALASGIFVGAGGDLVPTGAFLFIVGLWRLAIPVVVTYAVLRHQLFDLDAKVRFGISRATILGVFVFVFVSLSEAAPEILNDAFSNDLIGYTVGGVGAGLLFFALGPIQRMSDRFAGAAVPGHPHAVQPEAAYRTALEMALCDGALTRSEEHVLARLAMQLDIDVDQAISLRDEVEQKLANAGSAT